MKRSLVTYLRSSAESQNRKTFCFSFVFHLLFIFFGKRNDIAPIAKPWRTREEHLVSIWAYHSNTEISSLNILTMHACPTATLHTLKLLSLLTKKAHTPQTRFVLYEQHLHPLYIILCNITALIESKKANKGTEHLA